MTKITQRLDSSHDVVSCPTLLLFKIEMKKGQIINQLEN